MSRLSLDIVIPTFNRAQMLDDCLEAILAAEQPAGLDWRVSVVDNNSTDRTREVVESFASRCGERVRYLFEQRQGRSPALNCGIRASDRALIGMIDDDELLDSKWLAVIAEQFQDSTLDFIGGPYLGLWRTARPDWLPTAYAGVLGEDDPASLPCEPVRFSESEMFLHGGNAVVRKAVFDRIGLYAENLGRTARGLASGEDDDMLARLRASRANGLYVPALVIHHIIPPERVTRAYYRQWTWGWARSMAQMHRKAPRDVAYVGRIPRYVIGQTLRGTSRFFSSSPSDRFSAELDWRTLLGFIRGAYFESF